jgi:hypothetical protein
MLVILSLQNNKINKSLSSTTAMLLVAVVTADVFVVAALLCFVIFYPRVYMVSSLSSSAEEC